MKKLPYLLTTILIALCLSGGVLPVRAQTKSTADEEAIESLYQNLDEAVRSKDVTTIMSFYAPSVFAFDVGTPREFSTWAAWKKAWEDAFAALPGPVNLSASELNITVVGSVAYTHYINDFTFTAKDGSEVHTVSRVTDVLRKNKGKWLIVQEHASFPMDPATGKADTLSKP
jgi:ketosteroid isomerase-like protein